MDYFAKPAGTGPWPAVVVVHEIFGIDDNIRAKTDRMAEHGYLALAVDLFEGRSGPRCIMSGFRQMRAGSGPMLAIIETGRRGLIERDDCNGKVGVLGFCMGGGFALLAAPRGFDAAAVNYGPPPKDIDTALRGSCPIVASYGGADRSQRGVAGRLEASLTLLGGPHDVKEYPGATHSFMSEEQPSWVLQKLMGLKFDPDATRDTWQRIDSFFADHLG